MQTQNLKSFKHPFVVAFIKKVPFLLFFYFYGSTLLPAQQIQGIWIGSLEVQGIPLPIHITVEQENKAWKAHFSSPAQNAFGIPFHSAKYKRKKLTLTAPDIDAVFKARLINDTLLEGVWTQFGVSYPLHLTRFKESDSATTPMHKPQDPTREERASYTEKNILLPGSVTGVTLGAAFVIPEGPGPFPAVVLVNGSGPQDRNATVVGHKPFLIIAHHLALHGIASIRYDDRQIGESTGLFDTSTTADFTNDAETALTFLLNHPTIDSSKVGVIGHSEGGLIAAMLGARNPGAAFLISLAGPAGPISQVLLEQLNDINVASGSNNEQLQFNLFVSEQLYQFIQSTSTPSQAHKELDSFLNQFQSQNPQYSQSFLDSLKPQLKALTSPWFHYFINTNAQDYWEQVQCPVLAIFAENDLQVRASSNMMRLQDAFKNERAPLLNTYTFPNLNHLMQTCSSGLPGLYAQNPESFNPEVIKDMIRFIGTVNGER